MNAPAPRRARLEGWKQIAAFLRMGVRRARRHASLRRVAEERLPVWRLSSDPTAPVCAYTDELEEWEAKARQRNPVVTRD
jgi:hypothetical protein